MKTITIIGVNYYPEDSAIGQYTTQLAEYLVNNGFEVKAVVGFPYYPSWKIKKEYNNKKTFLNENVNNVTVYRYKQYVPKKPSFLKRIVHLVDFTLGSFINIFKIKSTDLVLCVVPFTSTIFLGKVLSRLRKAKLWVHIQDFEFDAATESNMIGKENIFIKILLRIESSLLNRADAISTISRSMIDKLETKSKSTIPKHFLPNWVDIDKINPITAKGHKYLNSNKFKILYSGNIGEKQDWQFFLDLAKRLKNNKEVEIVVVGDGVKSSWLINEIKTYPNVEYYDPVAYIELSNLLCSADVHILFQKYNIIDTVMPSKILAMMASQKPSIITGNLKSELATIINESKGGFYYESNDIDSVLLCIDELIQNNDKRENLGANARGYVVENFSSQKILNKFRECFEEEIQSSK